MADRPAPATSPPGDPFIEASRLMGESAVVLELATAILATEDDQEAVSNALDAVNRARTVLARRLDTQAEPPAEGDVLD